MGFSYLLKTFFIDILGLYVLKSFGFFYSSFRNFFLDSQSYRLTLAEIS